MLTAGFVVEVIWGVCDFVFVGNLQFEKAGVAFTLLWLRCIGSRPVFTTNYRAPLALRDHLLRGYHPRLQTYNPTGVGYGGEKYFVLTGGGIL
jgi:hypothetical protein